MKKKAGTFFKSVLNKGKGLFNKKDDDDSREQRNDDEFGTEEDHDFIEVGKSVGQKVPSK